jgi:putative zinc finger/helix-turn-helix YgiT family protein
MTTSGKPSGRQTVKQCPVCENTRVDIREVEESFVYGAGENAVTLKARIPVIYCDACNMQYATSDAERRRHEAVCRHLSVMTPSEIRYLRKKMGLSRRQLAELTGVGEASIARWERGAVIQNRSLDQLLYLLSFPENIRRLQTRRDASAKDLSNDPPSGTFGQRERIDSSNASTSTLADRFPRLFALENRELLRQKAAAFQVGFTHGKRAG